MSQLAIRDTYEPGSDTRSRELWRRLVLLNFAVANVLLLPTVAAFTLLVNNRSASSISSFSSERPPFASQMQIRLAFITKLGMTDAIRHAPNCSRCVSHCSIVRSFLRLLPSPFYRLDGIFNADSSSLRGFECLALIFQCSVYIIISLSLSLFFLYFEYTLTELVILTTWTRE